MTHAAIVLACVLQMTGDDPNSAPERCNTYQIKEIADAVLNANRVTGIPTGILAADGYQESRFKLHARGKAGEIGIWQIKPHGAVQGPYLHLSRRHLEEPRLNALIAAKYMATMRESCPTHYLSRYNGNGCCPSGYERKIRRLSRRHPSP